MHRANERQRCNVTYDMVWYGLHVCGDFGSGNGLLFDGTKQLHEPMLTSHSWGPVIFTNLTESFPADILSLTITSLKLLP